MSTRLADNVALVRQRISSAASRCGRTPEDIRLLAVSKTVGAEAVREAFGAGITDFAENRMQEAAEKMAALHDLPIKWHFIGHLQTNKAKAAVKAGFELIHSIDSDRLLFELDRQAEKTGRPQRALIEVNVGGEESKHGVAKEAFMKLLEESKKIKSIKIEGLMAIPPFFEDPEYARPFFRRLRALRDEAQRAGYSLPELSMGMSHDFEMAIEEGATIIRLGTILFGERKK
ncbi:MAG: YggS family pyridoxal phosphate-dependent enzyme [Nitrospiraceae bacterium]|nr:YggS family pyridoxal phosphate-dependent enzyme [Nitrospiraceae bacterium]